jgi:hypothetical protein
MGPGKTRCVPVSFPQAEMFRVQGNMPAYRTELKHADWWLGSRPNAPSTVVNNHATATVVVWYSTSATTGAYAMLKPGERTEAGRDQGDFVWWSGSWYKQPDGWTAVISPTGGISWIDAHGNPKDQPAQQNPGWLPNGGGPPPALTD